MMAVLYDLLYALPLCLMAVTFGKQEFGGPEQELWVYLVATVAMGLCILIKHWKNRLKFLAPGVLIALGIGVTLIQAPEARGEFLVRNQWILWTSLTAVASFAAGWLVAESRIARRGLALITFAGLLVIMGFGYVPDKAAVALALFLLVLVLADEVQRLWEKSGYVDGKGHLVSIAPFLLALCLLVNWIPAPNHPYDWNFAVKLWERAVSCVKLTARWMHGSDEDYGGVVDFSDENGSWGNLSKKDKDKMILTGSADAGQIAYLAGKVMDSFDGRSWSASYEGENRDRMLDTLETLCAVTQRDPEYVRNYVWRVEFGLQYEDFNTKYLFVPLKAVLGNGELEKVEFVQKGGNLEAVKKLGYGTEYSVIFMKLNQGNAEFQEFLRSKEEIDPKVWEIVRAQYEPADAYWEKKGREKNAGTSYEEYLAYRERIYEYYLPETNVSDQLMPYLEKWLEGAETDYDKLSRIESVLSQYRYTETPGKLPAEVTTPEDFLDYFLLEKQEGYCNHFATVFVLLARSQGIPARFVQGFYVPRDQGRPVSVKSSMAHAWPEAYLDGIGWITFEPTPGKKQEARWNFAKKTSHTGKPSELETEPKEEKEEDLIPPPIEKEKKGIRIRWSVIFVPLGMVLAFLAAFLFVDQAMIRAKYQRLDETGKFKANGRKCFAVLGLLGWEMAQGETLEEFRRRVGEEISGKLLCFLEDYEWMAYAGKAPTAETRQRTEKCLEGLLELLREEKGRWFFWYRFKISRMEVAGEGKEKRKGRREVRK